MSRKTRSLTEVKLSITQEIINKAEPCRPGHCMIALALREEGFWGYDVNSELARANLSERKYFFLMPLRAKIKVIDFDKGKTIKPWAVTLKVIGAEPVKRRGLMGPNRKKTAKEKETAAKKRKSVKAKVCKRRYHGKAVIEIRV